jgi:peptide/nickel transport system substrate-binding protein
LDASERNTMYGRLGEIIYEEAPWVFLWNPQGIFGVREEVEGWEPHQDGIIRLLDAHLT